MVQLSVVAEVFVGACLSLMCLNEEATACKPKHFVEVILYIIFTHKKLILFNMKFM